MCHMISATLGGVDPVAKAHQQINISTVQQTEYRTNTAKKERAQDVAGRSTACLFLRRFSPARIVFGGGVKRGNRRECALGEGWIGGMCGIFEGPSLQ